MGCCGSSDAAGDKPKSGKGIMKPDIVAKDLEDVTFERQVRRATYGPDETGKDNKDVTTTVQELIRNGDTTITGGIHTAVGNLETTGNVFRAWYLPLKPDAKWDDFDTGKLTGVVVAAYYGVDENPFKNTDVTARVQKAQAEGKNEFIGGCHNLLNEPMPMDPGHLAVYYS